MNYYRYICDSDEFHCLVRPRSMPIEWVNRFDGRSFKESWVPPVFTVYKRNVMGNFPRLAGNLPVFDKTAWSITKSLIADYVEALPLNPLCMGWPPLYLINVTTVIDCLDFDRSQVVYFEDGTIMNIRHYAFRKEAVSGIPIFRIKDYQLTTIIVNEDFREIVDGYDLKGLIWNDLR